MILLNLHCDNNWTTLTNSVPFYCRLSCDATARVSERRSTWRALDASSSMTAFAHSYVTMPTRSSSSSWLDRRCQPITIQRRHWLTRCVNVELYRSALLRVVSLDCMPAFRRCFVTYPYIRYMPTCPPCTHHVYHSPMQPFARVNCVSFVMLAEVGVLHRNSLIRMFALSFSTA